MKKISILMLATTSLVSLFSCNNNSEVNVTFKGEHVSCTEVPKGKKGEDLVLNLNLEYFKDPETEWKRLPSKEKQPQDDGELYNPCVEYELSVDDIHVTIGEKEEPDSFTYEGSLNGTGILTIRKDYIKNKDINIICNGRPRTSHIPLVGCQIGNLIKRTKFNTEIQPEDATLEVTFKSKYQNTYNFIFTLDEYGFTVWEDDDVDIHFEVINNGDPLPEDIWFRTNARWGKEGVEFTRNLSADRMTCDFHVPYFYTRDHIVFRSMSE